MELSVISIKGKETGRKIVLADSIYKIEPNDHAVYLDVKQFLANQRQGTHKAKERAELPCLIILDINMPVLDGKETLSILKKTDNYKDIPVVVFTTSESEIDRLYCKKFNTEMVTKPPTFKTLANVLDKLLKFCR